MIDSPVVLIAGGLMALALVASFLAARIRVPGLVLFLAVGMLVGSDGLGWIEFSDYELERDIGVLALALIIFEGGLAAGFSEIRPVLRPAIALAVVGTIATAVITGLAAAWLLDLSTLEGMLLGSIVASTDAAAIFAVLRGSTLRRRLARTLEGEAGFNDPVAALLVIGFIDWIQQPDYGVADMAGLLVIELAIGVVAGLVVGRLAMLGLQRLQFASPGLYPVASITAATLSFGLAEFAHGSGFLAVYLTGLMLGSARIPAKRSIVDVPRGPGVGRAADHLPHPRPARLPLPARRRLAGGDRPRPAPRGRGKAGPRHTWPPSAPASRWPSGRCWAGRACAARSRWCSPRSR